VFSSDFSEEEKSDEEIKWNEGDLLADSTFSNTCSQNFHKSDEIEFLTKDKISTPIKCFILLFTDQILDKIAEDLHSQCLKK